MAVLWWTVAVLVLVTASAYATRVAEAERALAGLAGQGWDPTAASRARALHTLQRQQLWSLVGGAVAALAALPFLDRALSYDGRHGLAFPAMALGWVLGSVAGHLGSGRILTGPRVADAAPRRLMAYLTRVQLLALGLWAFSLAIAVPWVVLETRRSPVGDPEPVAAVALLTVAAGWMICSAVMAHQVLRRGTDAREPDDLVWQEWLRARVLRDLADSVWICVCAVFGALWVTLVSSGATTFSQELAGWLTALAAAGLVASWVSRTDLPAAVREAQAC